MNFQNINKIPQSTNIQLIIYSHNKTPTQNLHYCLINCHIHYTPKFEKTEAKENLFFNTLLSPIFLSDILDNTLYNISLPFIII